MTTTSLSGPSFGPKATLPLMILMRPTCSPALKLTPRNERPLLAAGAENVPASYCPEFEKPERRTIHLIEIGKYGAKPGNVGRCSRGARECKRNVSDFAAHLGEKCVRD